MKDVELVGFDDDDDDIELFPIIMAILAAITLIAIGLAYFWYSKRDQQKLKKLDDSDDFQALNQVLHRSLNQAHFLLQQCHPV